MNAALFAHQGGWDEMAMVAGPIALFALAMRTANRRASRLAERVQREARVCDGSDGSDDSDPRHVDAER